VTKAGDGRSSVRTEAAEGVAQAWGQQGWEDSQGRKEKSGQLLDIRREGGNETKQAMSTQCPLPCARLSLRQGPRAYHTAPGLWGCT
jgi:hypothetical protein